MGWGVRASLFLLLSATATSTRVAAQTARRHLDVRGHISGANGDAVFGAVITVSSPRDHASDATQTDSAGNYHLAFAHPDTSFSISVRALGYAAIHRELARPASPETDVIADFRLTTVAQSLATVSVKANRPIPVHSEVKSSRPPGSRGARLDASSGVSGDVTGDINATLAMVDGVLPTLGGSGLGVSAFGQASDQNGETLNGADGGGTTIPRDGPRRSVRLATYDPKIGRFSGAQISTLLPSGTDYRSRSIHATVDGPFLQWPTGGAGALPGEYQNQILSGALAGPIRPGKTLYSTGFQVDRSLSDLNTLQNASTSVLNTQGIARESVDRLLSAATALGIPLRAPHTPSSQVSTGASAIVRIDFTPAAEPFITGEPDPQLDLLVSGAVRNSEGGGVGLTGLPSRATRSAHSDALIQLDYAPYLFRALNETKLTLSMRDDQTNPDLALPSGLVLLDSRLQNRPHAAMPSVTAVALGGNSNMQHVRRWQAEASNDWSWMTFDRTHTFELYGDAELIHLSWDARGNALGNFTFNSLSDFAAGHASAFSRDFSASHSAGTTLRGAVSFSDTYLAGPLARSTGSFFAMQQDGLRLQYGVRVDLDRFGERPAYNAVVDSIFNTRNDHVPNGIGISPMVGFTWNRGFYIAQSGAATMFGSRNVVDGGIREYRGVLSPDNVDNVARSTGLVSSDRQLTCVGDAAPYADWRAYLESAAYIPAECAGGGEASALVQQGAPVLLYARNYAGSRSWRGELNWTHMLTTQIDGKIGATYALNLGGLEPYDLNLYPEPRFVLADEADRPVFVAPTSIAAGSGLLTTTDSRVSSSFDHVTELRSGLRSWQRQVTGRLEYTFGRTNLQGAVSPRAPRFTGQLQASYTYAEGRAQASGFSGTTAGDPRRVTWGPFAIPRNTFKLLFTGNVKDWFSISTFGQLYSGFAYTPMVSGDINGDGYSYDRAFVFDPGTAADPALGAGMSTLLANAPSRARDCLRAQVGRIAGRGSCTGPWTATVTAVAIEFDPYRIGFGNRGSVSLYMNNPLGGLDRLLHDDAHLRGWGTPALPDPKLLTVRGFDAQTNRFRYTVNPRFGSHLTPLHAPFRITLDVRIDIGPNRETEAIDVEMRRANEASGLTPPPPGVIAEGLRGMRGLYGHADFDILEDRADEIGLDSVQLRPIGQLIHANSAFSDSVYANLATYLSTHASSSKSRETRTYWHDAIAATIRHNYETAVKIRGVLQPDQIAWLRQRGQIWVDFTPEWLRNELRKPLMPH
jgi:hypothetical protein